MTIEQMYVDKHHKIRMTISSDDLITHSTMQKNFNKEDILVIKTALLELAFTLFKDMKTYNELDRKGS